MKKTIKKLLAGVVAIGLAASAFAQTSAIRYSFDGSTWGLVVSDNNFLGGAATTDLNGTIGSILSTVGGFGWSYNVIGAVTKPGSGSAAQPNMDMSLQGTASPVSALYSTLWLEFSDTDFSPLIAAGKNTLTVNNTGPISVTMYAYTGGNALFSNTSGILGSVTGNGSTTFTVPAGADPYALTLGVKLTAPYPSNNGISTDARTQYVPDGGSTLLLLGSAFSALAFCVRSRKS